MNLSLTGAAVGLFLSVGCGLVVVGLPMNRRPTLDDRLAPYVRDAAPPSRLLATQPGSAGPIAALEAFVRPVARDLGRLLERVGSGSVRLRLARLADAPTIEQFRAQQVLYGAVGLLAGLAAAVLIGVRQGFAPVPMLAAVAVCAVGGVVVRDHQLTRAVRRREEQMLVEFPTIAELLALSVAAGEGAVGALDRVSRSASGELAGELRRTLADARAGASLVEALERMAGRLCLPILTRFVDGVVVAVERGTPLADVLRAQAGDVREAGRRQLMELGGKKEIAMMAPVVFLILPVTVIFAVYPGIAVLGMAAP